MTNRTCPLPSERPTIGVEEAAEILGIARSSGYAAAAAGEIPTIRLGRRLRVPTAALRRMLSLDQPSGGTDAPTP